jgi:hypothetical protein
MALAFAIVGPLLLAAIFYAFLLYRDAFMLIGLVPGLLGCGVGVLLLWFLPYDVSFTPAGVTLSFATRADQLSWSRVVSYRPLFLNATLTPGEAGIWTFVTYERESRDRAWAVMYVMGRGEGFGGRLDYETDFDRHVPEKRLPNPRTTA